MLKVTDNFPDAATISLDKLTGKGSTFDFDANPDDRLNAADRALERLEGIDVDGKRYDATSTMSPSVGNKKQ